MVWIGEIGYIWKGFPLWSIRRVLQEARTAPSFQHASVAERDKAANYPSTSFDYRCVVGLVGACPLLSYITPSPIIELIHLVFEMLVCLQNDRRPPPYQKMLMCPGQRQYSPLGGL